MTPPRIDIRARPLSVSDAINKVKRFVKVNDTNGNCGQT